MLRLEDEDHDEDDEQQRSDADVHVPTSFVAAVRLPQGYPLGRMTTVLGLFCVGAGTAIPVYWAFARREGWEDRPREWAAHVGAEHLLALLLVAAGAWLLADGWDAQPLAAAALGALLYAAVNVTGFFVQRGDRAMVAGMALQSLLTAAALAAVLTH